MYKVNLIDNFEKAEEKVESKKEKGIEIDGTEGVLIHDCIMSMECSKVLPRMTVLYLVNAPGVPVQSL